MPYKDFITFKDEYISGCLNRHFHTPLSELTSKRRQSHVIRKTEKQ